MTFHINPFVFISDVGHTFRTAVAVTFRFLFKVIKTPLLFIAGMFIAAFDAVKKFTADSYIGTVGTQKFFTGRIIRAFATTASAFRTGFLTGLAAIKYYFIKGLKQYALLFRYFCNILLPIGCLAALIIFFSSESKKTDAIIIGVNGEPIGIVETESDYLAARSKARKQLSYSISNPGDMLPEVTYTLTRVHRSRLSTAADLCDRLLVNSDIPVTNACGIFIDGEFLCAVKNEASARAAVLNLLNKDKEPDEIRTFVQNISFVQGLYSDDENTVWQPEALGFIGEYLKIKTIKSEVTNEESDFETIEIQSDALYKGTNRTVVKGVNGIDQITSLVTYIDGEAVSSDEISRIKIQETVAERIQVGTKPVDKAVGAVTLNGAMLMWPVVGAYSINSPFGYRWGKFHEAIDIGMGSAPGTSEGKTIVAAAEGIVVAAGTHSGYGYYVKINHGNGLETLYAHCLEGSLMVNAGDRVSAGQPIARVGMSGYATGPHLHFETILYGTCVDPCRYLGVY